MRYNFPGSPGSIPLSLSLDDERRLCLGDLPRSQDSLPARPGPVMEWLARHLLLALAPPLEASQEVPPPDLFQPFSAISIGRSRDAGTLDGWFFPADTAAFGGPARGAVLMCHPWLPSGQSYFFRRRRVPALRAAGYHVMTFDFGGFGSEPSGPMSRGFCDVDVDDALDDLARRSEGLPLHLWGVSAGGYWAHLALSRRTRPIHAAVFEHVTDHLIEWSKRTAPRGLPCYLFFQHVFAAAYRFLDLRSHAGHLAALKVAYIGGDKDDGVPVKSLHRLARRAGASRLVVPGAAHLDAIRRDGRRVVEMALETFRSAEDV